MRVSGVVLCICSRESVCGGERGSAPAVGAQEAEPLWLWRYMIGDVGLVGYVI